MKNKRTARIAALVCTLLVFTLLLPSTAGATVVYKYGRIPYGLGKQEMSLMIEYMITGPGDYKILWSNVWGRNREPWFQMYIYLYIYSNYPYAQWYEYLGNIPPYGEKGFSGNIPQTWYWNRAGTDIGVAYVDDGWSKGMDWNVQVGLP